ncbi:MAG TPA: enterotoxin (HBL) [Candidatus Angelobacter sp.]|jgi:phage host-nuclease inhibitor protein Gam|nr:enterotoxin (HBL) [Candidatus Angelobacter sp.]
MTRTQSINSRKGPISLVQAIRQRKQSLGDAQNTYKQNVVAVNTLITSVLSSSLPTLHQNPPDWAQFVAAYEQANSGALNWVNTVMARLLDVPADVQGYNNIISQLLQDAKTQGTTLVSQPNNSVALLALTNDLSGLSGQMNLVVTFISGAVTAIQNFGNVLPGMATQLQTIATKSANDANVDKAQIAKFNADIQKLHADISSLTAAIVALSIADGIALTLGGVITVAAWPIGALVWLMLGPAVAVATTYIALDAKQIVADKAQITQDQTAITGLTADVATLQLLSTNFGNMAAQTQVIEANLRAILQEWQTLESDINAAISDIQTAISDKNAANFTAVVNDVTGAITEWNEAYAQAGSLTLDLQVTDAQLQVGMSQSQVQAALAGSQTTSIIAYYNRVSAIRKAA